MKQFKLTTCFIVAVVLLYSCKKEHEQIDVPVNNYQITSDEANLLATSLVLSNQPSKSVSTKSLSSSHKKLKNQKTFIDEYNQDVFYAINYKEGGFIILSADKRTMPILAYSIEGEFSLDESSYPLGLQDWLGNSKAYIKETRKNNRKLTNTDAKLWNLGTMNATISNIDKVILPPDDGGGDPGGGTCQDTYETIGPLVQSKWGQGYPYNEALPYIGCTQTTNGKPLAGCVAIAIAQVMRYHQYPANYNWANMPVGDGNMYTYSSATATLVKDVGTTVNMTYGCSVSGADGSEIASSLISDFGYRTASNASYNYNTIKSELRARRPVILTGYNSKSTSWLTTTYYDGHAWVCDGMMSTFYCEIGINTLYFHMNWGANDTHNAWYAYNGVWNAENTGMTFGYERHMIYNIKP